MGNWGSFLWRCPEKPCRTCSRTNPLRGKEVRAFLFWFLTLKVLTPALPRDTVSWAGPQAAKQSYCTPGRKLSVCMEMFATAAGELRGELGTDRAGYQEWPPRSLLAVIRSSHACLEFTVLLTFQGYDWLQFPEKTENSRISGTSYNLHTAAGPKAITYTHHRSFPIYSRCPLTLASTSTSLSCLLRRMTRPSSLSSWGLITSYLSGACCESPFYCCHQA